VTLLLFMSVDSDGSCSQCELCEDAERSPKDSSPPHSPLDV